jgi:hypothetical protein
VSTATDGTVELAFTLADPWTGSEGQQLEFAQTLDAYVSYAADREMVADHPETKGRPWRSVIYCPAGAPEPEVVRMVDHARRIPELADSFEFRPATGRVMEPRQLP